MKGKLSWPIFWALVGVFIVILCLFFVPVFRDLLRGSELFLLPIAVFFLLGVALIFFTVKEKVAGILKKFFLLTGAAATGFFVSILLHNAIYALFIYWFGADFWDRIGVGDEPFFFFVAIFVCPIGFLVGTVGSIVLAIKNKQARHSSENI
ncbi:hypothetical protein ES703_60770 [subsurface metagenome]